MIVIFQGGGGGGGGGGDPDPVSPLDPGMPYHKLQRHLFFLIMWLMFSLLNYVFWPENVVCFLCLLHIFKCALTLFLS